MRIPSFVIIGHFVQNLKWRTHRQIHARNDSKAMYKSDLLLLVKENKLKTDHVEFVGYRTFPLSVTFAHVTMHI